MILQQRDGLGNSGLLPWRKASEILGRHRVWLVVCADWLAVAAAASLPWSTSATGILVALWLLAFLPGLDPLALRQQLMSPAGGLPVALWLLAALSIAWADVAWTERIAALDAFHKLLVIPLLLVQFRRSGRGVWVLAAFLLSCTVLLAVSYFLALWPGLTWRGVRSGLGVPVKDYIAQSGEFAICVFVLLAVAQTIASGRAWLAVGSACLAVLFLANYLYLETARTALAVTMVLLGLFAFRQFGWKKGPLIIFAALLVAVAIWESSPFLRGRLGMMPREIERYWYENASTSAGERLEYWRRSLSFVAAAPVLGHGAGATRELFRQTATGQSGASALVSHNPHNQTLAVAIQLGAAGAALLWAMWIAHLLLFRGPGLAAWIGLVITVQNVVSGLFNSHLFDFTQGWIYVFGVGVAGGTVLGRSSEPSKRVPRTQAQPSTPQSCRSP
jgi:O-antigen ligase